MRGVLQWRGFWVVAALLAAIAFGSARFAEIPLRSALRGWDNSFYQFWLRSLVIDGDWDFRNEVREAPTLSDDTRGSAMALPLTANGQIPNKYGIGWAIANTPAFVAAHAVTLAANATGLWNQPADGYSAPYQVSLQLWNLALAAASLWLLNLWLTPLLSLSARRFAIPAFWLCSPLLYYQSVNLSMAHNLVFLLTVLAMLAAERAARSEHPLRWIALCGCALGLLLVTRYQAILLASYPLWRIARHFIADADRKPPWRALLRPALIGTAAALPAIALQLLAWRSVYGQWLVFSYGVEGESFNWLQPALWQVWLHPHHGALYWHPAFILCLGGLALGVRQRPDLRVSLASWALGAIALWYVHAAWWAWPLGAAFGYRGFDALWPVLCLGLGLLFAHCAAHTLRRRALFATTGLLAAWNLNLCLLYCLSAIPRNAPLPVSAIVRATLDTWPQLPALLSQGFHP